MIIYMDVVDNATLTTKSISIALDKVGKANHIELEHLQQYLTTNSPEVLNLFDTLLSLETIDERFDRLVAKNSLDTTDARYLLEASLLL